jgi:hypothetical protein
MATLVSSFKNPAAVAKYAPAAVWDPRDVYRLRGLPNEDVYFYSKRIDNTRLMRQADPRARTMCWSLIRRAAVVGVLLLLMLLPKLGAVVAGYRMEALKQDHLQLVDEQVALELEEARLLSPQRLQELAQMQELVDPAPAQVVYLNPKPDKSLALNRAAR